MFVSCFGVVRGVAVGWTVDLCVVVKEGEWQPKVWMGDFHARHPI